MDKPVRLGKSENCHRGLEAWLQNHATPILLVCIILLFLLIVALLMTMLGVHANTVTGTEANVWQNMEQLI